MKDSKVTFYDIIQPDDRIEFVNIVCFYQWKWVLVKWKWKTTWELPWWHVENWEKSLEAAKRELYEETWIAWVELEFLCSWKIDMIIEKPVTYYWNVYITKTSQLWELPESEIEEVGLFENIPENLTYPANQIEIFIKSKEFRTKNKMF